MRRSVLIACILFAFSAVGQAQEFQPPRGWGYIFVAPGTFSTPGEPAYTYQFNDREYTIPGTKGERHTTLHVGGGYERLLYRGLGAGADIGIQTQGGVPYLLFSANGSYHFPSPAKASKLVPFLTGGYSGAGSSEWAENWFNVGGGVKYWFREKKALILEFRDQVDPNHDRVMHFLGFRIGLAWR